MRNQRIRSRSWEWWGWKSKRKAGKFYRNQDKVEVGRGVVSNVGIILRGNAGKSDWNEELERSKIKKRILQTVLESLAPTVG